MTNNYFALGYECNHKCICCPLSTYNRLHAPLDFEQISSQIDALDENDEINVTVSGGEPTLHKDFFKTLDMLREKKANITVLSNASSCQSKDFVKRIAEHMGDSLDSLDYVTAIHSSDPSLHDAITGVHGSLEQTLTGLDNLVEAGIKVSVKHIMSGMTCHTMRSTFEFLDNHFPESVSFHFCAMDYSGNGAKNSDKLFINFRKLQPYLEETLDLWDNAQCNNRKVAVFETPLCAVDPYYWRFFTKSSREIKKYLAPGVKRGKPAETISECTVDNAPCCECDVRELCDGVWRSSYEIGKNEIGFIEPIKAIK